MFYVLEGEVGLFYAVGFGDEDKIVESLFLWIFGDEADGRIFKEKHKNDDQNQNGQGEEDEHDEDIVGQEEEEKHINECAYTEHGGQYYFEILPSVFLHELGQKDVAEVERLVNADCKQHHPHHAQPQNIAQGYHYTPNQWYGHATHHYHLWSQDITNKGRYEAAYELPRVEEGLYCVEGWLFGGAAVVSEFVGEGVDQRVGWDEGWSLRFGQGAYVVKALLLGKGGVADVVALVEKEGGHEKGYSIKYPNET